MRLTKNPALVIDVLPRGQKVTHFGGYYIVWGCISNESNYSHLGKQSGTIGEYALLPKRGTVRLIEIIDDYDI